MADRVKVIKGLEICANRVPGKYDCNKCPYEIDGNYCEINLTNDAIALLKEQEEIRHGEWKWSHGGECSECGYHNSNFDYKYCPMCGAMMEGR